MTKPKYGTKEYWDQAPWQKYVVRNNPAFVRHVRQAWQYFMEATDTYKIVIRKNDVFIHIRHYYCAITNDLKWIRNNPKYYEFEASKKALYFLEHCRYD